MEVSQAMAETVSNMTSELADNLEPVASILENIVNAGSTMVEVLSKLIRFYSQQKLVPTFPPIL